MELTTLDRELLDGLQVLTDVEISRVQAHLAAGLPMQLNYGWPADGGPSCFGCLFGTAMSRGERYSRDQDVANLALDTFLVWATDLEGWRGNAVMAVTQDWPLTSVTLNRLAALLDMEWSRRVMATSNPVEQTHDSAIIPSLEAMTVG